MYKYTVTYDNYNGDSITRDLYFNLSEPDMALWESSESGGISAKLDTVVKTKDIPQIMEFFTEIIDKSYGERSADGENFFKSPEILYKFKTSKAFEVFFMKLLQDSDFALSWIKGIMPSKYQNAITQEEAKIKAELAQKNS